MSFADDVVTKQWTKQWGTINSDDGYGVSLDKSGNAYVAGSTLSSLDGNTDSGTVHLSDIFLTKYNSSGVKQWTKQWGTVDDDCCSGVAIDVTGNIYVTGYTPGSFSFDGFTNFGSNDIFLTKFDSSGTKQWTRQWGTSGYDYGYGVAIDAVGNVYVTGSTEGSLDGNSNAGSNDAFLTKYNSSGVKQWTNQWGTSSYDSGRGVAIDTAGNAYVAGYTAGTFVGNTNTGNTDIFLTKFDSGGTKQWTRQWGSEYLDYGYGVAIDTVSNVYVTGTMNGGDIFLTKYDSNGTSKWTKVQSSGLGNLGGKSVAIDAGGNAYVAGGIDGSLPGNTSAGSSDIFLTKYNSSGSKQWTKQWGTSDADSGSGVAINTAGNNAYVTGTTYGSLDGNTNAGSSDIFLTKYLLGSDDYDTNNAPTLTYTGEAGYETDGVNPNSGYPSTQFTYKVNYTDIDNDAPYNEYPKVHILKSGNEILGSPFTMGYVTGTNNIGAVYEYAINTLQVGSDYSYYFEAYDIYSTSATGIATQILTGPTVLSEPLNTSPTLDWSGETNFTTSGGYPLLATSTMPISYRIKYTDVDNDSPKTGYPKVHILKNSVEISSSPIPMSYVTGINSSGAIYQATTTLTYGTYVYYFEAYDIHNASATGTPTVQNAGPQINDTPLKPTNQQPSNTEILTADKINPLFVWSNFYDSNGDRQNAKELQVRPNGVSYGGTGAKDSGVIFGSTDTYTPTNFNLEEGTYYWHVRVQDNSTNGDQWSDWSDDTYFTIANNAPILAYTGELGYETDGVDPNNASSTQTITYRIAYTDADNEAPKTNYPKLHILKDSVEVSGSPISMSYIIGISSSGAIYQATTTLASGTYGYYFEAYDIHNTTATGTPTSQVSGPVIASSYTQTESTITVENKTEITAANGGIATINPQSGPITVDVPGGAFGGTLTLSLSTAAVPTGTPNEGIKVTDIAIEVSAGGQQPGSPITITVYYNPATLPAGFDETKLVLARYDVANSIYIPLPSTVNTTLHKIVATTSHLSTFALVQLSASSKLSESYAYPVPFNPKKQTAGLTFSNLTKDAEIKIYTITGAFIKDVSYTTQNGKAVWDGKDSNGEYVSSDVYIAVIKNSSEKKIIKIVVEK